MYSELYPRLIFSIKVWKTGRQVRLMCSWARLIVRQMAQLDSKAIRSLCVSWPISFGK